MQEKEARMNELLAQFEQFKSEIDAQKEEILKSHREIDELTK